MQVSANSYTQESVLRVGEKPFNEEVWNTAEEKFLEQEIVVDKVKCFLEIHQDCSDSLTAPPRSNVELSSMKHCSRCVGRRSTSPSDKLIRIKLRFQRGENPFTHYGFKYLC